MHTFKVPFTLTQGSTKTLLEATIEAKSLHYVVEIARKNIKNLFCSDNFVIHKDKIYEQYITFGKLISILKEMNYPSKAPIYLMDKEAKKIIIPLKSNFFIDSSLRIVDGRSINFRSTHFDFKNFDDFKNVDGKFSSDEISFEPVTFGFLSEKLSLDKSLESAKISISNFTEKSSKLTTKEGLITIPSPDNDGTYLIALPC